MNITSTKKGDYNYPDLVYSKNDYPPLGKYGMLRKTYLIENFKVQYSLMLMNDTLWPHLLDIDKQAHDMMDTIVEQMKQERGITEQLKAETGGAGYRRSETFATLPKNLCCGRWCTRKPGSCA